MAEGWPRCRFSSAIGIVTCSGYGGLSNAALQFRSVSVRYYCVAVLDVSISGMCRITSSFAGERSPVAVLGPPAEYKQVTVLFADVVRSMGIRAAVDVERLREIMTELVERSAAVVRRYGGGSTPATGS
jgi:hypothetical protein